MGPQGSGWFSVAPTLLGGVPLDGLMCQTVLSKCLGPLPRWERTLRVARECGYNMIHFTPVQVRVPSPPLASPRTLPPGATLTARACPQELGASNSSYSIAHQLRVNPAFGADVSFADIENLVSKMRSEWKVSVPLPLPSSRRRQVATRGPLVSRR